MATESFTKDESTKIWASVGMFLSAMIGIVLIPIISGFIVQILWGWFIIPLFHMKSLSLPEAIGLSLIVGYFKFNYPTTKDNKKTNWGVYFGGIIGFWILVLVEGFIVHLFI